MPITVTKQTRLALREDLDVAAARRNVMEWAKSIGLGPLDRTKVVTAASELARNTVLHGGGGIMSLEVVREAGRDGIRMTFEDTGPGIADLELALTDGYTTGNGMGLGLPGARRLVSDFQLASTRGVGTSVTIVKWKP